MFLNISTLSTNNGTVNLSLGGIYQLNPAGGTFTKMAAVSDRGAVLGMDRMPTRPGLGVAVDEDKLRHYLKNST